MVVIKIAFAFDHNFYRQAGVAISSLLDFADSAVTYEIYCLCSYDVKESDKKALIKMVKKRSTSVKMHFKTMDRIFDESYEVRGITTATYFRLLLHRLLPDVNKIIYADVDVLFKGNLLEVWEEKLGDNLLAAVKDPMLNKEEKFQEHLNTFDYFKNYLKEVRGAYFNAGFLLMNLKEIRNSNLEERWIEMAKRSYNFQDQDILNITCAGKVAFLSPKFNVMVHYIEHSNYYRELCDEHIFTEKEIEDVYKCPVVIHFAGPKPWNSRDKEYFSSWWKYIESNTSFYNYFVMRYEGMEMRKELFFFLECVKMVVEKGLSASACLTRALTVFKRGGVLFYKYVKRFLLFRS